MRKVGYGLIALVLVWVGQVAFADTLHCVQVGKEYHCALMTKDQEKRYQMFQKREMVQPLPKDHRFRDGAQLIGFTYCRT